MKKKKIGVVTFPGSNCDDDCLYVIEDVMGQKAVRLWHKETDLGSLDGVVLPGGFSYGDYLRTGAVARFSPVMNSVIDFAKKGKPVIGICNGFQILLEAGLLPGAMLRNRSLRFVCRFVNLRVESTNSPFTRNCKKNEVLRIPIAHGEGNYFADPETLDGLKDNDQILLRYVNKDGNPDDGSNPNGSAENIAGICNKDRNVFGLMPHPERASEKKLGSSDGRVIFESMIHS